MNTWCFVLGQTPLPYGCAERLSMQEDGIVLVMLQSHIILQHVGQRPPCHQNSRVTTA
jgi:hypothetical protein